MNATLGGHDCVLEMWSKWFKNCISSVVVLVWQHDVVFEDYSASVSVDHLLCTTQFCPIYWFEWFLNQYSSEKNLLWCCMWNIQSIFRIGSILKIAVCRVTANRLEGTTT